MMMPLLVERVPETGLLKHFKWLAFAVAGYALTNTWVHLARFASEARGFDAILDAVPERSNVVQLTYDAKGSVMRTHPYLHFGAYIQARKGGMFAVSFPILFWNIPIRGQVGSNMPATPKNLEWAPSFFSERHLGRFYDTVLIRKKSGTSVRAPSLTTYSLDLETAGWQLYRHVPRSGAPN